MIAGGYLALPRRFRFGVFLIGAGILLGGLESIVTRRMEFRVSDDAFEAYAGAPVLIAAGLLVIGIGVLMMLYPHGRSGLAWTLLVRVPRSLLGIVFVTGRLAGIGFGAWDWREPLAYDRFVASLPQKIDRFWKADFRSWMN